MGSIILIHLYNDRSGSPKVLSQAIKALKKNEIHTELITSSNKDGFLTGVANINKTLFYRRSENKLITLFYYVLSQVLLFFQCLRYWNQDVVFYINTMMPFGAALAGKFMGKSVVYHIHETSLRPKILKQFLRFVISVTADRVIFVSDYLKKAEYFKNKEQYVVYNAIENAFLAKVLKNENMNSFNVLMICSLKKYKGIFEFIKIATILQSNSSIMLTLVLNADQSEIDEYFKNIQMPSNIKIFSRQTDVSGFYASTSLLMNLSRTDEWIETFGLTVLEGMAFGLPVIVPPVGGPAEIVRDGREGYLISSYEVEKIAHKIEYLVSNKDEYMRLSNNGLNRVEDFSEDEFEKSIIRFIEGIE